MISRVDDDCDVSSYPSLHIMTCLPHLYALDPEVTCVLSLNNCP